MPLACTISTQPSLSRSVALAPQPISDGLAPTFDLAAVPAEQEEVIDVAQITVEGAELQPAVVLVSGLAKGTQGAGQGAVFTLELPLGKPGRVSPEKR